MTSPEEGGSAVPPSHPLQRALPAPVSIPEKDPHDGYPKPPMKRLTVAAQHGAYLDALGLSRKEIAETTGVNPERVSQWRRDPGYIQLRREEIEKRIEEARVRLELDQQSSFASAEEAREVLRQHLYAKDPDGYPILSAQQKAAEVLMNDKARTSQYATERGSKIETKIQVGAVFNVYPDDAPSEVRLEGEVIDVEEVEEDGDR